MSKRYYWLKLQDDFFASKRIKKLRRMAGGDTYTIIYLKMQLMAMKHDGTLSWSGLENSIVEELALDLDESEEDVEITLTYLLSVGLAETSDNINYFFPFSVENVGSESSSAQRVRECRERKLLQCNTDVTNCNSGVTQVKQKCNGEIEKEIDIENRVDVDKNKKKPFGANNVWLSDWEYEKLKSDFPNIYNTYIERLSNFLLENPSKHYNSHYATIRKWIGADTDKQSKAKAEQSNASYDLNAYKNKASKKLVYERKN